MQATKTYRVALFDENIVSRRGLQGLINDLADFKVVVTGGGLDVATVRATKTDVVVYAPPNGFPGSVEPAGQLPGYLCGADCYVHHYV